MDELGLWLGVTCAAAFFGTLLLGLIGVTLCDVVRTLCLIGQTLRETRDRLPPPNDQED